MAIRYIVDKDKGIVVATLNDCKYDAINTANSWTGWYKLWSHDHGNVHIFAEHRNKYLIPNKFTGIAKCSVNDTWDEEIGKKIARDRLLTKYHRSLNKALIKIDSDFCDEATKFHGRIVNLYNNSLTMEQKAFNNCSDKLQ